MNQHTISIFIASTLLGVAGYTGIFLFVLGLRLIRHAADNLVSEIWLVTEIGIGTLVVIVSLTGAALIFFDRTVSGRFFYIAAILAAFLILLTLPLVIAPFKDALGLGKYTWIGLVFGNSVIVTSNIASFFLKMPSFL